MNKDVLDMRFDIFTTKKCWVGVKITKNINNVTIIQQLSQSIRSTSS